MLIGGGPVMSLVDHRLPTLDLAVARERGAVDVLKAFAQRRRFLPSMVQFSQAMAIQIIL